MTSVFEFIAESRNESGKSVAKAIRRAGNVPAVLYGAHANSVMLSLNHNEVQKHLVHEAVYSHILDLSIDGKFEKVILKGLQRHPAKAQILHMDFQRVNMQEQIRKRVPIHYNGELVCAGVKSGGILISLASDIEVTCLPGNLPEFIEIDVTNLGLGGSIHMHDLTPPAGVQFTALTHEYDEEQDLALVKVAGSGGSSSES
jgi:large subunit ribosomal protein L25